MNTILSHTVDNNLQLSKIICKPIDKKDKLNIKMLYPPFFKVFCEEKYKCIINNKVNIEGINTNINKNMTEFENKGNKIFKIIS